MEIFEFLSVRVAVALHWLLCSAVFLSELLFSSFFFSSNALKRGGVTEV